MFSNSKEVEDTPDFLQLLICSSPSQSSGGAVSICGCILFFNLSHFNRARLESYCTCSLGSSQIWTIKHVPSFLVQVLVPFSSSLLSPMCTPLNDAPFPLIICYNGFQLFSTYRNISQWRRSLSTVSFSTAKMSLVLFVLRIFYRKQRVHALQVKLLSHNTDTEMQNHEYLSHNFIFLSRTNSLLSLSSLLVPSPANGDGWGLQTQSLISYLLSESPGIS